MKLPGKIRIAAAAATAIFISCLPAQASLVGTEAAVSFPHGSATGLGNSGFTVGWTFDLDSSRAVSHLGIYTSGNSSILEPRTVNLWDATGALVSSASFAVGGGAAIFEATSGVRGFSWLDLATPVALSPNELYTLSVFYSGDNSPGTFYNADITTVTGFNYGNSVFASGGGGGRPTTNDTAYPNGWFGPNIRFQSVAAAVPLPGAGALMALGLAGLLWRQRSARLRVGLIRKTRYF